MSSTIFALEKSSDLNNDALGGFCPLRYGIPRIAIVAYYLVNVEKFLIGNTEASQCAPDLGRGQGWRKGGFMIKKQVFSRANIFLKNDVSHDAETFSRSKNRTNAAETRKRPGVTGECSLDQESVT